MKAILAVAVFAMAAFAGIMIVGDDTDAATGDLGDYTVTYSFDGSSIVKKMDTGNQFQFSLDVGVVAPTGYILSGWKDVKSGAVYDSIQTYTFTNNVVVEPVFTADRAIVQLVYGTEVVDFFTEGDRTGIGDTDAEFTKYTVSTVGDLKKFAEAIGATVIGLTAESSDNAPINATMSLFITGFEFKGFVDEGGRAADMVSGLKNETDKTVKAYTAVFEPVYDISFVVEGASVLEITSDKVVLNTNADREEIRSIPVAPSKDNYIFMGWYDAAGEKIIGYSIDKDEYTYAAGDDFKFTEDIVLYAKFVPVTFTVTFVYGEEKTVFTTETVKYGNLAIEPKGLPEGYKGWDWSFGTKIIADTEIVAIVADPVTVYNVTFEIDGKAPVTQRSDSMVLPDTKIEGKVFQGWVVKGASQYVDPMTYEITGDITFVAVYKEADPPAGPGFFETTTGQCVAVIIAVVIIALIYAVATNMFGLKDALTSVKIMRVKK